MPETLTTFLKERREFLRVGIMPRGDGWEVVLRIDGTYFVKARAEEMARYFREIIERLPA